MCRWQAKPRSLPELTVCAGLCPGTKEHGPSCCVTPRLPRRPSAVGLGVNGAFAGFSSLPVSETSSTPQGRVPLTSEMQILFPQPWCVGLRGSHETLSSSTALGAKQPHQGAEERTGAKGSARASRASVPVPGERHTQTYRCRGA